MPELTEIQGEVTERENHPAKFCNSEELADLGMKPLALRKKKTFSYAYHEFQGPVPRHTQPSHYELPSYQVNPQKPT